MARNPLNAVPATRSSLPLLKIRRRLVLACLVLAVLSGLLSAFAWLTADHSRPAPVQLPDQAAVSLAQTAAADFLAARKSAVPAVADVNADFSGSDDYSQRSTAPLPVTALNYSGSTPYWVGDGTRMPQLETVQEKFDATIGGRLYEVTVPMVKSSGRWLLGAAPSVAPAHPAHSGSQPGLDYERLFPTKNGSDGSDLPPGYVTQINSWANRYASAGRADHQLYLLTGDQQRHTYSGLGGWRLISDPVIKSAFQVAAPRPGYVVRVGLVLASPAANGPTLSTDYDLYLASDHGSTAPPVLAWGPAGSYQSLQPYSNHD